MYSREDAAAEMIAAARAFYDFGWLLGTSGNLSTRLDHERFLITASGRNKGELRPEDFLVCDATGTPVDASSPRPSAETAVHVELYQKFEGAGAIFHVHEIFAALCSDEDSTAGATIFESVEMIKGLDVWAPDAVVHVPIVENFHDIPRLAKAVSAAATERVPAVMVHNHGYYAWGKSSAEARRHVETLAYLYRYSWERRQRR